MPETHQEQGQPPVFHTLNLPSPPQTWSEYQKKVTTRALRVHGPFVVQTSEGPLHCADGYLAVDARGYPYPIATEEFNLIYEPVVSTDPPEVRPDLPYRCPDCVTVGALTCPHQRPTAEMVARGAQGTIG